MFKDLKLFWNPTTTDGEASFSDFKGFAGWEKPAKKLFKNKETICGVNAALLFEP